MLIHHEAPQAPVRSPGRRAATPAPAAEWHRLSRRSGKEKGGKKRKEKKRASPDPLEGRGSVTPTGCSQVAVSGGKRTSQSAQITASLAAARGGTTLEEQLFALTRWRCHSHTLGVCTYIATMYLWYCCCGTNIDRTYSLYEGFMAKQTKSQIKPRLQFYLLCLIK